MTLDAMHWVWNHSQSKGNARLALLCVADQVRTPACEVRLSYADFMVALNAPRNSVRKALKDAVDSGELEVAEPAVGRRAALYRIPKAVGYARDASRRGSDSDPLENGRGSDSDPLRPSEPSRRGSDSDPPPPYPKEQAGQKADGPDVFQICQPLITAMTQAGITVSWSMQPSDWNDIAAIVQRAGVSAMVAFARDTRASAKQPIRYATFFLRGGWRGLPPVSANGTRDSPNGTRPKPPHCGDPDCDPVTRTREVEDTNGLRSLVACPECHPDRKGRAA